MFNCSDDDVIYSWIVNVNCLLRLFSNRFGAFISIIQFIPIPTTKQITKLTNIPDHIGAVVNPIQLYASSNRFESTFGCTYYEKQ